MSKNFAALFLDQLAAERQAETGSLAVRLGREEGLKDFLTISRRNPPAAVIDQP